MRALARVAAVSLLACQPTVLLSQQRDSTVRDTTTSRRRTALPAVVVTGTLATPAQAVGVARTIVDHDALLAEPSRQAVDALRHVVGVHIDEANGPIGPTIIRLRGGEETFTRILMDGVEINENGGYFDAQGVTLVNVDRIEVARGPQSAVYGSSAMSGVVQMFTRSAPVGAPRVEASMEGGRNTWYGRSVRAAAEAMAGTDRARYTLGVGSSYDRGVYRLPNDMRANDASVRVDLLPTTASGITSVVRFMGVDAKLPVRDPGVHRAPLDPNQRQGRDRTLGTIQGVLAAGEHWTHRLQLSHYVRDFTYDDAADGLDQSQFDSYVFDANYHYESIVRRSTARYVGTAATRTRGADVALSYGGEWERESLSDRQSGDFGPAAQRIARPSVSGFGELQAGIGRRASLLIGSRVEKFHDLATAHVPRATLLVDVVPRFVSLRAAVSRAYKAPNIQEQFPGNPAIVANPDLKPETSHSWETGADIRNAGATATASLTYFRQDYQNLIRTVNYDATRQIARNIGRSRVAGLELEAAVRPDRRWTLGGDGSWIASRIVDNGGLASTDFPNGGTLPFRPTYTASAYVDAAVLDAVAGVVRVSAVGPQDVLVNRFSGPRARIDSYRLLGATVRWNLAPETSAYVQLENLLNATYHVAFDRPGLERAVLVGVRSTCCGFSR